MAKQLSRGELYALVWSESMKTLSERFGISDVALKKTCMRAEIHAGPRILGEKRGREEHVARDTSRSFAGYGR